MSRTCTSTRSPGVTGALGLYDPHSWTEDDENPFTERWDCLAGWLEDVITLYDTSNVYFNPRSGSHEIRLSHWPDTVRRNPY